MMCASTSQPAKRRRIENDDNRAELVVRRSDLASQATQNLYLNPEKADVYFVCGDQKDRVPAHKLILSTLSNAFNEMFYGESTENANMEVELPHTSPGAFEEFLQLFYLNEVKFHNEYITEIINLVKKYRLPERSLYDVQIPPAQESPQNILNALNDDCIQAMLRKLNSVQDYLNAIETCTRFKKNARFGLSSKLLALHIREDKQTQGPNDITIEQVRKFLELEGVPVQSITWVISRRYPIKKNLNLIADAFGKTLTELKVERQNLMVEEEFKLKTRPQLHALKKLSVKGFKVPHFRRPIHSQLVALNLDECEGNAFERHFTMLEEFDFRGSIENIIGRPNLLKFLQFNPQLTRLKLRLDRGPAWEFLIGKIPKLLPRLNNLFIQFYWKFPTDNLVPLSRLRKLQYLRLEFPTFHSDLNFERLFDALAANDVRIEELTIVGNHINDTTQLRKLKYLRKLCIEVKLNQDPIDIILNAPNLEEIRISRSVGSSALTIPDIRCILECATNFKRLRVKVDNIKMNLEEYNSLLALVEDRLEVRIYCERMILPANVLEANNTSKCLKIEKTSFCTETYIGKFV